MVHGHSGKQNKEMGGRCLPPIYMSRINEDTEITVSLKSIIAGLTLLGTFIVTYFDTIEELHILETEVAILKDDLEEAQANIRELAIREMDNGGS